MLYLSHHVNILRRRTNQIYPFRHDSAETFGFLASPSARSHNKRVSGSARYARLDSNPSLKLRASDIRQPLSEIGGKMLRLWLR
jgi:hypothetical protein